MTSTTPSLLIPMTADIGGLEIARLQARQFLENNHVDEHTVRPVSRSHFSQAATINAARYSSCVESPLGRSQCRLASLAVSG